MSRKLNDLKRQQQVPMKTELPKIELSKIREEVAFYRETIDYLMNRGMTFANCIRIIASMQLGQSFPEALLETFSSQDE